MTNTSPQSAPPSHVSRTAEKPDVKPLLLASGLSESTVRDVLGAYGVQEWKRADQHLQAMAGEPASRKALAAVLPFLMEGVAESADPDQALNEWDRYLESGINRLPLFQYLHAAPHVVRVLSLVFGNSPAMAQTFHRDPMLVYWIEDDRVLTRRQSFQSLQNLCRASIGAVTSVEAKYEALRRFKRREMLRLGIRDFAGEAKVEETYTALSDLAGVVVQAAYELVQVAVAKEEGEHGLATTGGESPAGFCVLGMGKLGGWELNYSSDIDLVYVHNIPASPKRGTSPKASSHYEEYFHRVGRELTRVLSEATPEGALFRVDLRLRPEGSVGPLTCSVDDALRYYQTRGRTWERLAFLKAKPLAGDLRIGQRLLRKLRPFVLGNPETAADIIPSIQSLRRQILSKIIRRGELERHVKLGTGGIREIEFIVQGLQLRWGHKHPGIMERQTLKGLTKLVKAGLIDQTDAQQLRQSYRFLRDLEHKIQMVQELQTHLLPVRMEEVAKCAVRMGEKKETSPALMAERFLAVYRHHTSRVHSLYTRIIG